MVLNMSLPNFYYNLCWYRPIFGKLRKSFTHQIWLDYQKYGNDRNAADYINNVASILQVMLQTTQDCFQTGYVFNGQTHTDNNVKFSVMRAKKEFLRKFNRNFAAYVAKSLKNIRSTKYKKIFKSYAAMISKKFLKSRITMMRECKCTEAYHGDQTIGPQVIAKQMEMCEQKCAV